MDKNAKIIQFLQRSFFVLFFILSFALLTMWIILPKESYYLLYLSLIILANSIFILLLDKFGRFGAKYVIAIFLSFLILIELSSLVFAYIYTGRFPWRTEKFVGSFQFHPLLAGMPIPNYSYINEDGNRFSHNSQGFRGEQLDGWFEANKKIVAIGGSTTYDIAVSNNETWTYKLEKKLGKNKNRVLNMGVPGQSSAEHVVMTSLIVPDYKPDVILYYMGFNDLRNSHLTHLKSDYSDYHLPRQYAALGIVGFPFANSSTIFLMKYLFSKNFDTLRIVYEKTKKADGIVSDKIDDRLLQIYARNIKTLIVLSKAIGASPVFIPQLINHDAFKREGKLNFWIPFIPVKDVPKISDIFNGKMIEVADNNGAYVIDDILKMNWEDSDFGITGGDYVHFSSKGTEKFADLIAKKLKEKNLIEK